MALLFEITIEEQKIMMVGQQIFCTSVCWQPSFFARLWEKYLSKRRQHKQTGSRQDETVLSEHSTTSSVVPVLWVVEAQLNLEQTLWTKIFFSIENVAVYTDLAVIRHLPRINTTFLRCRHTVETDQVADTEYTKTYQQDYFRKLD